MVRRFSVGLTMEIGHWSGTRPSAPPAERQVERMQRRLEAPEGYLSTRESPRPWVEAESPWFEYFTDLDPSDPLDAQFDSRQAALH